MSRGPQLEDGYLRIANELVEAILGFDFSHREQSVVFAIVRKTYGFNRKEDDISASQIGDMCKIARPHVTSTLNALAQRNVITKRVGRFGSIIGIQKNHRLWIGNDRLRASLGSTDSVHPCTDLVHPCTESVHVPKQYADSTESVQVDSTDSVHTKDNLPKDNQQKTSSCASQAKRESESSTSASRRGRAMTGANDDLQNRFERFYAAYPRKKSRKAAEKAFARIDPDEQLLADMLSSLGRAMTSGEWSDPQFIPYPATWLNADGWRDEVQATYAETELAVIRAFNDAMGEELGTVSESIFVAERAAAIRDFATLSAKPGFIERYFPWVRDNVTLPPKVGFDWIVSRKGFTNITSGQHAKRES